VIGARPAPRLDAALDALSAHVAVLDSKGVVVAVNQAWRRFGIVNGLKLAKLCDWHKLSGRYCASGPCCIERL
jgi:nucleotidyltransferase/DNA polymerase involved in DNA repair